MISNNEKNVILLNNDINQQTNPNELHNCNSTNIKYEIKLEHWYPITSYRFNAQKDKNVNFDNNSYDDKDFFGTSDDICSICRNNLIDKCPTCKKTLKKNKCFVSSGECLHFFHKHCITEWLKTCNVCPSDMLPFVFNLTNIDSSGDSDFLKIIHNIIKQK